MRGLTLLALFAATPAIAADSGEYLTRAADCAACHTAPGGTQFAGGRAFTTPFGVIYSPNITPDAETGIGNYTDAQWLAALHQGIGRNGEHLYPAMPYTNYTLLSDGDALAIKTYLFTQKPVHASTPAAHLRFPYNQRWGLALWNAANNPNHRFVPNPAVDATINRGAYLTEALGHCAQCHSPRNWMQGVKSGGAAYAGAIQQGWRAYNITADKTHGLGGWSDAALEEYLSTGKSAGHGAASGPMAEAISNSLRYLTAPDIHAMAAYLRTIPASDAGPAQAAPAIATPDALGERVFGAACSGCHLADGTGRQSEWAALAGAHTTADPAATNLLAVLLHGSTLQTAQGNVFMPSLAAAYTDDELAAVANYSAARFAGVGAAVTPGDVAKARKVK
jgi:mono/diheme cytochrome c family protein